MEVESRIRECLQKGRMMQVATAKDNQPWNCTVYFACDEALNMYWISLPESRHSKEIQTNKKSVLQFHTNLTTWL